MVEIRNQYKDEAVPLAPASKILDAYQRAVSSTFRPNVRDAIMALNEMMGRARETIARLKKTGDGMFYFARVYSGEHDTAKIEALLKAKWPDLDWDVEAVPPSNTEELSGKEKELASLPLYRAFVGDAELEELKLLNESGKHVELEIKTESLVVGVF